MVSAATTPDRLFECLLGRFCRYVKADGEFCIRWESIISFDASGNKLRELGKQPQRFTRTIEDHRQIRNSETAEHRRHIREARQDC